ncbi:hypothetical protein NEFER03_1192 [Nematocida sp. LUAm3]|nr:hypothetical protein NEFER03_1192 [Nematocida sp. LUAm3]KAI5175801.1 hypothetical protein NEFER02_1670 [Nematocida sp. LUAm2]KAI5178297.1 hypothetical protein NEFER01_1464 [Nematocida sp. LUAm1]
MDQKSINKKSIFICAALGTIGLLVATGGYLMYQKTSVAGASKSPLDKIDEMLSKVKQTVRPIVSDMGAKVEKYVPITEDNISELFQKENTIPTRYYGETEISIKNDKDTKVNVLSKAAKNVSNIGWFRKKLSAPKEPESELLLLEKQEMKVQLENSRLIRRSLDPIILRQTNMEKTPKKDLLIRNLYFLMEKVDGTAFTTRDEIFSTKQELFWPVIFHANKKISHWLLYNCSEKNLTSYNNRVFDYLKKQNNKEATEEEYCNIIKDIVSEFSSKIQTGLFSEKRQSICKKLAEYKGHQMWVKEHALAYETEKFLCLLDLISYFVHPLPEYQDRINVILKDIETYLSNVSHNPSEITLADYATGFKECNERLIEEINTFARYIADLEQYINVNLHIAATKLTENNMIKFIKAYNESTHVYDLPPSASALLASARVNELLEKYSAALHEYFILQCMVENNLSLYGFIKTSELEEEINKIRKQVRDEIAEEQKENAVRIKRETTTVEKTKEVTISPPVLIADEELNKSSTQREKEALAVPVPSRFSIRRIFTPKKSTSSKKEQVEKKETISEEGKEIVLEKKEETLETKTF